MVTSIEVKKTTCTQRMIDIPKTFEKCALKKNVAEKETWIMEIEKNVLITASSSNDAERKAVYTLYKAERFCWS